MKIDDATNEGKWDVFQGLRKYPSNTFSIQIICKLNCISYMYC